MHLIDDQVCVRVEEFRMICEQANAIARSDKPRARVHTLIFSHSVAHPEGNFLPQIRFAVADTLGKTFGCDPTGLSDEHFHFRRLGSRFWRF